MTMYLPIYYAAMYNNHSSMRKVHLVTGHVVYVYWIDTVYVQKIYQLNFVCLFVCFVALRPQSTAMVIAGRSVHLTTLFPGQA